MGFLDAKERILDVVLTDKGRELLSQNLLDFEFYAFSDEGVDYAAALTASLQESGSVDEHVHRTLTFEATQRKDYVEDRDLKTFLYTIPSRRKTLPEFTTNFDDRPDLEARRKYFVDTLILNARRRINRVKKPTAVVVRTTANKDTQEKKMANYALQQRVEETERLLAQGKNVVGRPVGFGYIMAAPTVVLKTTEPRKGTTMRFEDFKKIYGVDVPEKSSSRRRRRRRPKYEVVSVKKEIEIVTGLDRLKFNLTLKSSEGNVDDPSGYLVEVYESGSDGRLFKLVEEDVKDVLEDDVLQKGFSRDMFVDVDVTRRELISQGRRLRRSQVRRQRLELRRLRKALRRKLRRRR